MAYDKLKDPRHAEGKHEWPRSLDAYEDVYRCPCGREFTSDHGYAICPEDRKNERLRG